MRWRIEERGERIVSGWIYDENAPERSFDVVVLQGDTIIGTGRSDEESAKLREQGHVKANSAFVITLDKKTPPTAYEVLVMNALGDGNDLIIFSPEKEAIGTFKGSYQSFAPDERSDSLSKQKLEALYLIDFEGVSMLDLGCNEGFFSQHALANGAKRVVGVDASNWFIEKAKRRVPNYAALEAEGKLSFRCSSWWDLPNERFNLILFLSAIHYEPRQKELLDYLFTRLAPGGALVLECGVFKQPGEYWQTVRRSVDTRRFPTENLLVNTLLSKYAVRYLGPSVAQGGDPVPRYVYYCMPKKNTALVIRGASGSGKTVLAKQFARRDIPVFSSDVFFDMLLNSDLMCNPESKLYQCVHKKLTSSYLRDASKVLVENDLVGEFCAAFVACLPLERELFGIEGEVFTHAGIFKVLTEHLTAQGVNVCDVKPDSAFLSGGC